MEEEIEITSESLYSDLRKWFLDNMDEFPKKLEAGHVYYYVEGVIAWVGNPEGFVE